MTERTYFGIDAGNSKTHAAIADSSGQVLSLVARGSGNWEGIGVEATGALYQEALSTALAEAGLEHAQIAAAGYGLAGYDFPSDDARLRPVVESLGLPGPFFLENDTLIALRAGTSKPYGVVCIAGSGSTKAGRNRAGETFRTWGMRSEMGDWGSGGWLCQEALAAVGRAEKGISPATSLTGRLLTHYGADSVTGLIEMIAREHVYRIDYVPLIFEEAAAGDPAAIDILLRGGHGLARGVNAVIRALKMEHESFDLVLGGGVFRADYPLLLDALLGDVRLVAPQANVVRLEAPPIVGALLTAMDEDGLPPDDTVRSRLVAGIQARLAG